MRCAVVQLRQAVQRQMLHPLEDVLPFAGATLLKDGDANRTGTESDSVGS